MTSIFAAIRSGRRAREVDRRPIRAPIQFRSRHTFALLARDLARLLGEVTNGLADVIGGTRADGFGLTALRLRGLCDLFDRMSESARQHQLDRLRQ